MIIGLLRKIKNSIKRQGVTPEPEQEPSDPLERLVKSSLKAPFSFSIDIVDQCNLRCVHCPRGVNYQSNTAKKMEFATFERLLAKISKECECRKIELFNWTEPFLHPELAQFVSAVKAKNIECTVSSNLSFKNPSRLEAVTMLTPWFIVSVSGFDQQTHERYHKGSNIEQVKSNLLLMAGLREKHNLPLHVEVHCLQFNDNQGDQVLWNTFCEEHGFKFLAKPACCSEVTTPETAKRLLFQPEFYQDADGATKMRQYYSADANFKFCPMHNNISINAHCDVYLCCIYWNREQYKIENFLNTSLESIQGKRLAHPDCLYCTVFRKN